MELIKDPSIIRAYNEFVENMITRVPTTKFIGGLPITLEKKDMGTLVDKNIDGKYKYSVTQKVDGSRYLMYITSTPSDNNRKIYFIDRENKMYSLNNISRRGGTATASPLHENLSPSSIFYSKGKMLLDGELVFFDESGSSNTSLDPLSVKGVSFMIFDILYGPSWVNYTGVDGVKKIELGNDASMAGPIGGPMWTYLNRYDLLNSMIVPIVPTREGELPDFNPPLTDLFRNITWFNGELKPLYLIDSLSMYKINIYSLTSDQGGLQKDLSKLRRGYYELIGRMFKKPVSIFTKSPVKIDGLIFTPINAEYTIGPWNKPQNVQFKWKPPNEQSIDFLIKKTKNMNGGNHIVDLLVLKGNNNFVPFRVTNGFTAQGLIPSDKYNDVNNLQFKPDKSLKTFTIGEFVYIGNYFVLKNFRKDKLYPNAMRTASNVWNSIRQPVDINDIYYFINLATINKEQMRKVLYYIPEKTLTECKLLNTTGSLISQSDLAQINEQYAQFQKNKDYEFEFRLGNITQYNFDTNISIETIISSLTLLRTLNWVVSFNKYVDVFNDKLRTRYSYSDELKTFIAQSTINKISISNVDISLKEFYNLDVRSALSNEQIATKEETTDLSVPTSQKALQKERQTFMAPDRTFVIDATTIQHGTFKNRNFKGIGNKTYQLEVEILDRNVDLASVLKFVYYISKNV